MDLDLVEGVREGLREAHELFSDGILDAAEWQEEVRPSRSPRAPCCNALTFPKPLPSQVKRLITKGPSPASSFANSRRTSIMESRRSSFIASDTFYVSAMDAALEGDERAEGRRVGHDSTGQGLKDEGMSDLLDDGRLAGGISPLLDHIDPIDFAVAGEADDDDGDGNDGRDGDGQREDIANGDDEGAQEKPSEHREAGEAEADLAGHFELRSPPQTTTKTTRPATSLSTRSHDGPIKSLEKLGVSGFHCKLISVLEENVMKEVAELVGQGSSGSEDALRKALEKHTQTCEASIVNPSPSLPPSPAHDDNNCSQTVCSTDVLPPRRGTGFGRKIQACWLKGCVCRHTQKLDDFHLGGGRADGAQGAIKHSSTIFLSLTHTHKQHFSLSLSLPLKAC